MNWPAVRVGLDTEVFLDLRVWCMGLNGERRYFMGWTPSGGFCADNDE